MSVCCCCGGGGGIGVMSASCNNKKPSAHTVQQACLLGLVVQRNLEASRTHRTLDAQLLSTAMPLLGACPGPLPNTLLRALQGLYAVPCHAVLLYHDLRPRRPSVGPSHHHHDISRRPLP